MSNKILVAYASESGSTAGVAEAIGRTLAEGGVAVDVRPMREVTDLAPYCAVVAGSAIHGGAWLAEGLRFVQDHRAELRQKPFAAFLVCMTMAMKPSYRQSVGEWMKSVRSLVPPVSEGWFAGVSEIAAVRSLGDRLKFRIAAALGVWPTGDHRDWNAIRAWAQEITPLLRV